MKKAPRLEKDKNRMSIERDSPLPANGFIGQKRAIACSKLPTTRESGYGGYLPPQGCFKIKNGL